MFRKLHPWVLVGIFLALASCTSTKPVAEPQYSTRAGETPKVGDTAEARVGEPLYVKFEYRSEDVLKLGEGLERDYPACFGCKIAIPPGAMIERRPGRHVYCTKEDYLSASFGATNKVCFTGHPSRDVVTQFKVPGTLGGWTQLSTPIPFQRVEVMVGEGFKSELVYQGVATGVVRLVYREYSESLARPAFQQDLTYTLESDGATEVGFRGLRLEILGADNSSIRYSVLSGL